MNIGLKFTLLVFAMQLFMVTNVFSQKKRKADKDTEQWRYEVEVVTTGVQGTYLIKVWSYSKDPNVAIEQAKKNALHGIIFRGFAGKEGVSGKKALASSPTTYDEHKTFFDSFFGKGGDYMKFVSITNDGVVAPEDRLKIGRKEYKIGVVVSVNVSELRKHLEKAGVVKGLSDGF